ncbi:phosphoesterase PA-phosphatase [Xylanimonas oleitrophica]|uniref:Phosphoesterase PA-phosphatase n=1 Tax=Xylanimonas oleitrophica TaxID=2607479 RepID=A0A2W5WM23_9MICO|nr:phosphatase PAP2 family protein [Xylanimonas oleitrophica]PZR52589.1 phosphoesterase PA-phosphatase [Xylanimonas oleitrophica]
MLDVTRPLPRHELPGARDEARTAPRVLAAVVALLAVLGVHATWRYFVATARGQRFDELAFEGAEHGQGRLWVLAEPVLDVVSVAFVVAGVGTAVVVALVRRRWLLAVQVAVLVAGSNVTTQVAKHWFYERPDLLPGWNGPNTLPSGHTTVAASVSAAVLVAVPRAWRPAVAVVGAAWTGAMGVSTLVGQWHRPSDVVAALLVVLAWGAALCALTGRSSLDLPTAPGASMATPGSSVVAGVMLVGGAVAAVLAAVALADVSTEAGRVPFEGDVTAYGGGVGGVLAVTALVFALLLLLRQATARPQR